MYYSHLKRNLVTHKYVFGEVEAFSQQKIFQTLNYSATKPQRIKEATRTPKAMKLDQNINIQFSFLYHRQNTDQTNVHNVDNMANVSILAARTHARTVVTW